MNNEIVNVEIADKKSEYPIIIGNGIINNLYDYIFQYTKAKKFLVVTNPTVNSLYGKYLKNENSYFVVIEDGEIYKNIKSYEEIINKACEIKLERSDAIIALGGGVIGDLAGFAASTYLRGIDFIQVPTTLLAMVDSSVGGKTGFNNSYGKNLIGAFYQPKLVFTDISTLKTLDKIQLASGLGEVVKYGFIEKNCNYSKNFDFINYLIENVEKILNLDEDVIINVVKTCCLLKASVVKADEKENDLRRILNFGHTIGHGVEKALDYKMLSHGQAVIIGMKIIFRYAVKAQLIDNEYLIVAEKLMDKFALLDNLPKVDLNKVFDAISHDKKSYNNKIKYIIPTGKNEVKITDKIDNNLLEKEIETFLTN